jgi:hypothetical protein
VCCRAVGVLSAVVSAGQGGWRAQGHLDSPLHTIAGGANRGQLIGYVSLPLE